jgi:hypothetical protein
MQHVQQRIDGQASHKATPAPKQARRTDSVVFTTRQAAFNAEVGRLTAPAGGHGD